jgi:ankyrin repeat protein
LWSPLPGYKPRTEADHALFLECFRLVLERCDPNVRTPRFGRTVLHDVAASDEAVSPEEAVAFATMLLDAGARMDERDHLLRSTPLGWACRWGRVELVKLLLERGADPLEADAEPWATPRAWAEKMGHAAVLAVLREHEH